LNLAGLQDIRHRVIHNLPLDKLSRSTLTDPDSLEESLISTRANEMGIDNEEYIDGMVGCSVPIKNEDGHFIASLYTHVPVVRKSLEELMEYEPLLRQAALEISGFLNTPVVDNGE